MLKLLKEGDLVRIRRRDSLTLCISSRSEFSVLKECPVGAYEVYGHPDYGRVYESVEDQLGLIVQVKLNRMHQPLIYTVKFGEGEYSCKAILAHKYFEKIIKGTT